MSLNLKGIACVVVYPNLHISTAEAYARISPQPPQHPLREALAQPMSTWRDTVSNDFETALTPALPGAGRNQAAALRGGRCLCQPVGLGLGGVRAVGKRRAGGQ